MLSATFSILPGVGPVRERTLWARGIRTRSQLLEELRAGTSPGNLLRKPESPLPSRSGGIPDPRARSWIRTLEEAQEAESRNDLSWFLERLPGREHWRVLQGRVAEGLYLDIETTGGAPGRSGLTVLGVLFEGRFHQWVWPECMDAVHDMVLRAPFVGSFAGRSFDVPFLLAALPGFPEPRAQIDLLSLARGLGLRGGLKGVEAHYGLHRDDDVEGLRGHHAVFLWQQYRAGDTRALDLLLRYNRADVEMLPLIGERLCRDLRRRCPLASHDAEGHPVDAPGEAPVELRLVRDEPGPSLASGRQSSTSNAGSRSPRTRSLSRGPTDTSSREEPPVIVALAGPFWARLQAGRAWVSRITKPRDALLLIRAARPGRIVLDPEHAPLAESLRELGAVLVERSLGQAFGLLPQPERSLRERLAHLGVRCARTRREEELPVLALAASELVSPAP